MVLRRERLRRLVLLADPAPLRVRDVLVGALRPRVARAVHARSCGGIQTSAPSLTLPGDAAPAGHVQLGDDTTLFAWSLPDGVHASRLNATGDSSGPPSVILATAVDATRFTFRPMGDGALMAWSPPPAPSDVHVQRVGANLALGSSSVLATAVPDLDGIDAAEVAGGALVAWLSSGMPTSVLTVQAIDETGAPVGPPLTDDVPSFANNIRIVRTELGAMVVFEAEEQLESGAGLRARAPVRALRVATDKIRGQGGGTS